MKPGALGGKTGNGDIRTVMSEKGKRKEGRKEGQKDGKTDITRKEGRIKEGRRE
jgi:hypothetical protein